jgi:hypothetical protein
LHRLDDHAGGVVGQRPRILAVCPPVNWAGQPGGKRLAKALEAGGREREQAGAVICAVEGDDAGTAGGEVSRSQRDLDRVLASDAELGRPREPAAELPRDLRVGEIAQRMRDGRRRDGRHDPRVPVAERRDPEAAGEVEVLAPLLVPDAAALRSGPDHRG